MTESKAKFDPAKGEQGFSTGFVGALYMLIMVGIYSLFKAYRLPDGGPIVLDPLRWLPSSLIPYDAVYRDYYDLLFIILLGFILMVCWEKCRSVFARLLLGGWAGVGCFLGGSVVQGQPFLIQDELSLWMNWTWTSMEALYAVQAGGFLVILSLCKPSVPKPPQPFRRCGWVICRSAFYRWAAGLLFFSLFLLLTYQHPFYQSSYYLNWRISCAYLYSIYLFLGYPYALVTVYLKGRFRGNRSDPGFVLLLILRRLLISCKSLNSKPVRSVLHCRRIQVSLRDLLVKIFFLPLMFTFFFQECGGLSNHLPALLKNIQQAVPFRMGFDAFYGAVFAGLFVMDVGLAIIGYSSSSRWLDNKSRSVDPTLTGWLFALACYPPFNQVSSTYLPYDQYGGEPYIFLSGETLHIILKCATLCFFAVFVWATMAFGLRFSNLTNRGIITRGPYAFVRHPAYMAKNLAWWTSSLIFFNNAWQFVFLFLWNVIYFYRAITEERHLMNDPFYVQYCEKVRWRFVPGLI